MTEQCDITIDSVKTLVYEIEGLKKELDELKEQNRYLSDRVLYQDSQISILKRIKIIKNMPYEK